MGTRAGVAAPRGFATDLFGDTIYYTESSGVYAGSAQENIDDLASTLFFEVLHLFGFGDDAITAARTFIQCASNLRRWFRER